MIPQLRQAFNDSFREEDYKAMMDWITTQCEGYEVTFRIAETPVFFEDNLRDRLVQACEEITAILRTPAFLEKSKSAILPQHQVPNETPHTHFLVVDFGICRDENGELIPQLVEIQGFPSLFCYQMLLGNAYRRFFHVPADMTPFFGGLEDSTYIETLRHLILGDCHPENVILLEIEPMKQNTAVDFVVTKHYLGIEYVCISDLIVEGRDVYYEKNGRKIQVQRIYNRIIFDELDKRSDLQRQFDFTHDYNIQWVGHPNWFFRISKHSLPLLNSRYVPASHYLSDLETMPDNLDDYVLKPLFSFAGAGVNVHPTMADIDAIPVSDRHLYILQRKMHYEPVVETLDEPAKCEVRMMMVWPDGAEKPHLINNLIRLSKAELVGVRYNKDKTWVGSSAGFFRKA